MTTDTAGGTQGGLSVADLTILRPDGRVLLRDAGLTIGAGEVVLLVGPSGCGKSTLLMLLGGLLDSGANGWDVRGTLTCGGRHVDLWTERADIGGVVFQHHALFDELDARDNLRIARDHAPAGHEALGTEDLILAIASLLGDMEPHREVSGYSGGQRQRLAIARTVLSDRPVLLFDEPNSGLDIVSSRRLVALIRALCRTMGKPALIAVHHASELLPMADRVLVMDPTRASLTEIPPDAVVLERRLTDAAPAAEPESATPDWDLSQARKTRTYWFGRYLIGYLWQLCAAPIMLLYIAAGGAITGFVTIWFGFNYYSYGGLLKALLHDETLIGLGTVQERVALPLIVTILFVARNSAVIAADVGNRVLNGRFLAMENLRIPGRLYIFAAIMLSMVVGAVVLLCLGMLIGAWVSQETWHLQFPNQYRPLFRGLFFRNVLGANGWPLPIMGWVLVKAAVSALLASAAAILIGLLPKTSGQQVSQAVANAIVVGVIIALLVHAIISALTAV